MMRNFWSKKRNPLDEDMALLVEEMHSPCIENIAVFLIVARTVARTGLLQEKDLLEQARFSARDRGGLKCHPINEIY
jgi:hypothetical protein